MRILAGVFRVSGIRMHDMSRSDKFCFMPGDLVRLSPEKEAEANRRTGYVPWSDAKQKWVSDEKIRRYKAGEDFNGADIAAEYDRLHNAGSI